jgi:hypothetical protein
MATAAPLPPTVEYPPWAGRSRSSGGGDGGSGGGDGTTGKGGVKGKGRDQGKAGGGKGKVHLKGKLRQGNAPRAGERIRDEWGGVYVDGGYIYAGVFYPCALSYVEVV